MEPIEQDLYKALFHLDSITNAIDCANFMQAVKKDYWKRHKGDKVMIESDLDEILLIAWQEIRK